jgi:hypothetical protein
MFTYWFSLLLLTRFGLPKPIRYAILFVLALLTIAVVVWTTNLFLTLEQRTTPPHVHTHRTR